MKIKFLSLTMAFSVLLSCGLCSLQSAHATSEADQEMKQKDAEMKEFKSKISNLGLDRLEVEELIGIKRVILVSSLKNEDAKKFMMAFGGADKMDVLIEAFGKLSDDELIKAYQNNKKRNLEVVGDISKQIEDGKKAQEILDQTQNLQGAVEKTAQFFPSRFDLDDLIVKDYEEQLFAKLTVKLDRVPGDPEHIALTFKNSSEFLSFTKIWMTIDIKAEGRDVPYYTANNVHYPFMTPLKPGEERKEIISCSADCRKAMANDNVYGVFTINTFNARVSGYHKVLTLRSITDWQIQNYKKDLQKLEDKKQQLDSALQNYGAELTKLDSLLK